MRITKPVNIEAITDILLVRFSEKLETRMQHTPSEIETGINGVQINRDRYGLVTKSSGSSGDIAYRKQTREKRQNPVI